MANENDISGRVGLDYADFQRGITAMNQQIRNVEVSFRGSAATMDDWSNTTTGLQARISSLNEKLTLQRTTLRALTDEFNLLSSAEGDHTAEQQRLAGQMSTLERQINSTQGEIRRYSTSLSELDGSAGNAGDALNSLTGDINDTERSASTLTDVFKGSFAADIAASGVKKLADGLQSMAGAAKNAVVETAQYADDIATLSVQTGISTEKLQEYNYMTGLADVELETITGSMSKLTKNMATAQKGTGDAAAAFEALGVSTTNSDGSLRDNEAVFGDIINKLGEMTNETERDAYAMQIFGKSAQDLNPLIALGADGFANLAQEAKDMGYVMDGDALNSMLAVADAMDRTEKMADSVKQQIATQLAPIITEITDSFMAWAESVDWDAVGDKISGAIEIVSDFVKTIIENKDEIIAGIAGIAAGFVAFQAVSLVQTAVKSFQAFQRAEEGATIAQWALNAAQNANPIGLIIAAITALVTGIVILWNTNEDFRNFVIGMWEGIKDAVLAIGEWFATDFVDFFKSAWDGIKGAWSAVVEFFQGIWDGIVNVFSDVIGFYIGIYSAAWEGIKKIWSVVADWFVGVKDGIANAFIGVGDKIKETFTNGLEFIKNLPAEALQWGKDIVDGIAKGIKAAASAVGDAVEGVAQNIREFLHFSEPDKGPLSDFHTYMPDMMQLLVYGITSNLGIVANAANKTGGAISNGIEGGIKDSEAKVLNAAADMSNALIDEEKRLQREIAKIQAKTQTDVAKSDDEIQKEALESQLKIVQEFKKEYDNAIAEVQKSQDKLSEKLIAFGDLFTKTQTELGTTMELGDLQSQIDSINNYGDALENLKSRGVSDSLLEEIQGMSIEDATEYINKLLQMTTEDYAAYMALWDEKQQAAQRVAQKYYQSELDNLKQEYVDKIPDDLSEIKDRMQTLGENAAKGVAVGFKSQEDYITEVFKTTMENATRGLEDFLDINSPSGLYRDRLGIFMAQGVGVGFTDEMQAVSQQMNAAIPTSFNTPEIQTSAQIGEGVVNGISAVLSANALNSPQMGMQTINLVVDGKTLANIIFDPLKQLVLQRGTSLG